ncbi:hypothetical protein LLG07_03510 [bacterium]|nr:hypothetical protein [bacterium]
MNESDILTPEVIIKKVANHEHLEVDQIKSERRFGPLIAAKHKAMFLVKKYTGLSLAEIGRLFNDKDHATVLHACKSVQNQIDIYPDYREEMKEIMSYFTRWPDEFERYEHYNTDLV